MTYLSVCSGIEAVSIAWEPLGFKPIGFAEIEPFPCELLRQKHPAVKNYGDITQYEKWNAGKFDILVGGTPCQSFSIAGKRGGTADERGALMYAYLGIVEACRPRWIIWENVPGVLSSGKGNDFRFLLNSLAELGYSLAWRILDSKYFGVPQQRRRVFVVGYIGSGGGGPAEVLFEREILQRSIGEGEPIREKIARRNGKSNKKSNKIKTIFCRANSAAKAECYENLSPTLTAHSGVVAPFISSIPPRYLMPIECERIQGFPDNWTNVPGLTENFLVIQEDIK